MNLPLKPGKNALLIRQIDDRLAELKLSDRKACLKAGLNINAIRNIRRGRAPRAETINALADVLHAEPSELLRAAGLPTPPQTAEHGEAPPGYAYVQTLETRLGLGGGGFSERDMYGAPALLPLSLVEGELRGGAEDFVMLEVEGQSMDPVLQSGDRVVIDRRKVNPSQAGIFALWDGYGLVAKWLERIALSDPPKYRVSSENERFKPYEVLADEARIIGRIVWFARRL